MPEWNAVGKLLIVAGGLLVLSGLLVVFFGRLSWVGSEQGWFSWLGRLPGDVYINKDGFKFYLPITTCLLISLALNLIFYLVGSLRRH